jgi:hypothetical protein
MAEARSRVRGGGAGEGRGGREGGGGGEHLGRGGSGGGGRNRRFMPGRWRVTRGAPSTSSGAAARWLGFVAFRAAERRLAWAGCETCDDELTLARYVQSRH